MPLPRRWTGVGGEAPKCVRRIVSTQRRWNGPLGRTCSPAGLSTATCPADRMELTSQRQRHAAAGKVSSNRYSFVAGLAAPYHRRCIRSSASWAPRALSMGCGDTPGPPASWRATRRSLGCVMLGALRMHDSQLGVQNLYRPLPAPQREIQVANDNTIHTDLTILDSLLPPAACISRVQH